MKDKLFKHLIPVVLGISAIGYLLLQTSLLDEEYHYYIKKFYLLTVIIGLLFLLNKSEFIMEKFSLIFTIFVVTFCLMLGINMLLEFKMLEIPLTQLMSYIEHWMPFFLAGLLFLIYFNFFLTKIHKTQLDYLKLAFVSILVAIVFFDFNNKFSEILKYIINAAFWIIVLGMLFEKSSSDIKKLDA